MAPPPPPSELIADVTAEILLRLPPDEPEHLFRAALVCKPWLRILCDPAFLRRYLAFHGAPPVLGLLHRLQVLDGDPSPRFASTTSMPDFLHPGADGRRTRPLDCRHGRVLIHMLGDEDEDESAGYLVWNPVTGDRHAVPEPDIDWMSYTAAVFCTADGCDHLDCHDGPFRVAFVGSDATWDLIWASVYSSETGAWSTPVSLDNGRDFYVRPRRGALVGDEMYFTITRDTAIGKYDWGKNCLSVVKPPPPSTYYGWVALMTMVDGSLGLAGVEEHNLYQWSRKVNSEGAAEWALCRIIELETVMPMANLSNGACVVGSAEGVGVIFINTDAGLFTIELKSGQARKVDERGVCFSVLPYMSFYTPDRDALLSLARTL
ncbi:unnamed protein product [Urochloa decumbens]|uniref:F-box protein AT5G49610-like beta-propeller domain-containing protein n=1 Tax=Urochloa decumbens TaxID=240449 RepID=A0ABC9FM10_9POAL